MSGPPNGARRAVPYLMLLPGLAWLLLCYGLPAAQLLGTSLYDPTGSLAEGYAMTWAFGNYPDALARYWPQLLRSLAYAGLATAICLALGYPLAYALAVRAGRWRRLMLVCVIAPLLTNFLVRTLAWTAILADTGWLVGVLRDVGVLDGGDRLIATPFAVVAGLTYTGLPFMVLPLYASLSRLDRRLLEAAADLYASPVRTWWTVTVPLSVPGLVAGAMLTFIPAVGDVVNARLLGSPQTTMLGNVIESAFLVRLEFPQAAAMSFLLMAAVLLLVCGGLRRIDTVGRR